MLDAVYTQVADGTDTALDHVLRVRSRQHLHQHRHGTRVPSSYLICHAVGTGIGKRRTRLLACRPSAAHDVQEGVRSQGLRAKAHVSTYTQEASHACCYSL
jgi:hypothetical protein